MARFLGLFVANLSRSIASVASELTGMTKKLCVHFSYCTILDQNQFVANLGLCANELGKLAGMRMWFLPMG